MASLVEQRSFSSPEMSSEALLRQMEEHFPPVTVHTALAAFKKIQELHRNNSGIPQNLEPWKEEIDKVAAGEMILRVNASDFPFRTTKVGSEGDKETQYIDKASVSVKGRHGVKEDATELWGVSDVVEGTTRAARNEPGAVSTLAITLPHGIMPTPPDTNYMVKLIAPPQATEAGISLETPHEENLIKLIKTLGISPSELTQVTLNPAKKGREINQRFVDAAKKVGITLEIIDSGDFVPGVFATIDPSKTGRPTIVVGRGGFEEGVLAAAAARALEGFMEAQQFNLNPEALAKSPILTLDRLVPGPKETTLLTTTFITDDNKWFRQNGIRKNGDGNHTVTTMVIAHKGVQFIQHTLT